MFERAEDGKQKSYSLWMSSQLQIKSINDLMPRLLEKLKAIPILSGTYFF